MADRTENAVSAGLIVEGIGAKGEGHIFGSTDDLLEDRQLRRHKTFEGIDKNLVSRKQSAALEPGKPIFQKTVSFAQNSGQKTVVYLINAQNIIDFLFQRRLRDLFFRFTQQLRCDRHGAELFHLTGQRCDLRTVLPAFFVSSQIPFQLLERHVHHQIASCIRHTLMRSAAQLPKDLLAKACKAIYLYTQSSRRIQIPAHGFFRFQRILLRNKQQDPLSLLCFFPRFPKDLCGFSASGGAEDPANHRIPPTGLCPVSYPL